MKYTVTLEDTETDGVVTFTEETDADEDVVEYMWTDGNFACDCNRRLFWLRAHGDEPEVDDDPGWCGEDRYRLVRLVANGKVLAEECE